MLVSEIGEFGLIELLAREFGIQYPPARGAQTHGLLVGLGDDAVVTARREGAIIWTTDTMVAGEHFLPERSAWPDIGWKSLASNVSDIAAMGGTPHLALVTLTLPGDFRVEDAVELYHGLRECAEAYDVTLGGGDIVRSPVFSITVALSGWAFMPRLGEPRVLRRDTARPGDLVTVTGTLGDSAGGLRLLLNGSGFKKLAERNLQDVMLRPRPCVACGQSTVRNGLRCGIDVSDGLLQDLGHIATASRLRIDVKAAQVPLSPALRAVYGDAALDLALSGGEDYELIAVGPPKAVESYIGETEKNISIIGEIVKADTAGVFVHDDRGRELDVQRRGWDHFGSS